MVSQKRGTFPVLFPRRKQPRDSDFKYTAVQRDKWSSHEVVHDIEPGNISRHKSYTRNTSGKTSTISPRQGDRDYLLLSSLASTLDAFQQSHAGLEAESSGPTKTNSSVEKSLPSVSNRERPATGSGGTIEDDSRKQEHHALEGKVSDVITNAALSVPTSKMLAEDILQYSMTTRGQEQPRGVPPFGEKIFAIDPMDSKEQQRQMTRNHARTNADGVSQGQSSHESKMKLKIDKGKGVNAAWITEETLDSLDRGLSTIPQSYEAKGKGKEDADDRAVDDDWMAWGTSSKKSKKEKKKTKESIEQREEEAPVQDSVALDPDWGSGTERKKKGGRIETSKEEVHSNKLSQKLENLGEHEQLRPEVSGTANAKQTQETSEDDQLVVYDPGGRSEYWVP